MKKYFGFILIVIFGLFFSACNASEIAKQTPVVQTDIPKPTNTPTSTFTPEPTSTPEPLPTEKRIIGKWSGVMTNKKGEKIPAFWTFMDGGTMIIEINILEYSYGAKWSVEGDRIHIVPETDPDSPTYRDVEFLTDDVMILTKEETNIKETWTRAE